MERHRFGSRKEMLAELKAAGVTRNDYGKFDRQPIAVLQGACEKTRQRTGFLSASWRSAGKAKLKRVSECAICGAKMGPGCFYYRGDGRRAHRRCVNWWRGEVGDGHGQAEATIPKEAEALGLHDLRDGEDGSAKASVRPVRIAAQRPRRASRKPKRRGGRK